VLSRNLSLLMPEKSGSSVDSKMLALFHKCDTDGSGKLGLSGFTKALSSLHLDKHLEDYGGVNTGVLAGTRALFEDLDTDHDGLVDETMFLLIFTKLDEKATQQQRDKGAAYKSKRGSSIQKYEDSKYWQLESEIHDALEHLPSTKAAPARAPAPAQAAPPASAQMALAEWSGMLESALAESPAEAPAGVAAEAAVAAPAEAPPGAPEQGPEEGHAHAMTRI